MTIKIVADKLSDPRVAEFLKEHMQDMESVSPPESIHALDLDGLKKPEVSFWAVWKNDELLGCGALKELSGSHAELKSMRVATTARRSGVASALLEHLLDEAEKRGYRTLSLETGSMAFFDPARRLYERYGFEYCSPFGEYVEDPNSVFMTLSLIH